MLRSGGQVDRVGAIDVTSVAVVQWTSVLQMSKPTSAFHLDLRQRPGRWRSRGEPVVSLGGTGAHDDHPIHDPDARALFRSTPRTAPRSRSADQAGVTMSVVIVHPLDSPSSCQSRLPGARSPACHVSGRRCSSPTAPASTSWRGAGAGAGAGAAGRRRGRGASAGGPSTVRQFVLPVRSTSCTW